MSETFEIFLSTAPGLEPLLAAEAGAAGFAAPKAVPGGVETSGGWDEVWRANLVLRGAAHVLVRIGSFPAVHLAQLDKRARKFPWAEVLRADVPVRVDVTTRRSKIYHAGAAKQRIERAITEELGAPLDPEAALVVKVRIEDNLVTLSLDSSGVSLHKRGTKPAVGKAPMRETLAAMFLRACDWTGDEPLVDPMCGSGTFLLEGAGIAAGQFPGRARSFAFEDLASFDPARLAALKAAEPAGRPLPYLRGSDRDQGAVGMARRNLEAAGFGDAVELACHGASELPRPEGKPGLVIANPPYGARIGDRKLLFSLYGSVGRMLRARFSGWRVGIVTSDPGLASAMELPFLPDGPMVAHGGLKITLFRTGPLP